MQLPRRDSLVKLPLTDLAARRFASEQPNAAIKQHSIAGRQNYLVIRENGPPGDLLSSTPKSRLTVRRRLTP